MDDKESLDLIRKFAIIKSYCDQINKCDDCELYFGKNIKCILQYYPMYYKVYKDKIKITNNLLLTKINKILYDIKTICRSMNNCKECTYYNGNKDTCFIFQFFKALPDKKE